MKCTPNWDLKKICWTCKTCERKMSSVAEIKECENTNDIPEFLKGFGIKK